MSGLAGTAQWYLARDGEQFGPISEAEMARFVELGHLKSTDLLWRDGFPDWRPALVVFPPHPRPVPGDPRLARADPRQQPMRPLAEPLAAPAAYDHRAAGGYVAGEERRHPGVAARIARLLLTVAVLAGAAGAAYVYRAELRTLVVSLSESSSTLPGVDRRSLELAPLAGFRAGDAEAIDAALQSTALWKVVKREYPDWYRERITEAIQLVQAGKDETVIGQLMARKLAELRRSNAGTALLASADKLTAVATTYFDTLKRLRGLNPEACAGFIRRGETEPAVAALLMQPSGHTAHLQAHLTAVFEAIAEGRQLPRAQLRPSAEHQQMLQNELAKRGWTAADYSTLSSDLGQAPADKACQLVTDYFAAQMALPDPEARTRLLINSLRTVLAVG